MELWIGIFILLVVIFVWFLRTFGSPKATANTLLKEYDAFERSGVSEQDRLFKLLATRGSWKDLPSPFLHELASRLGNKENVIQFVVLSERHQFDQLHYPRLAADDDPKNSMLGLAALLSSLGNTLQNQGKLGDAEFVQLLALRIQPSQHFTMLPLAVTYYRMGRYSDAVPLFEHGLSLLEEFEKKTEWMEQLSMPADLFGSKADIEELGVAYRNMYDVCVKASSL